jgi:hypothetical protein
VARILYAWEIGSGYGHVGSFLPVALKLRERGHDVVFAVRDIPGAHAILAPHGFAAFQAPVWLHQVDGLREPAVSYPEILFRLGYLSESGLTGLARAWRQLFASAKADMLVADHSPTALLAARGTHLHTTMFGTGFCSPPHVTPLPAMRPWGSVPSAQLLQSEREALKTVNHVLTELRAQPLGALMELFLVNEDFLCTLAELDHYEGRTGAHYWGPLMNLHEGAPLAWLPGAGNKRIFAYLKPHRDSDRVIQEIKALGCEALIFAAGMPPGAAERLQTKSVRITTRPLMLSQITQQCDICICHAGHGTTAAMLMGGVPLLLLPIQLEQYLTAHHVAAYGAGLFVDPEKPRPDYARLLDELLGNPEYSLRAKKFAARYCHLEHTTQVAQIALRMEEILSGTA